MKNKTEFELNITHQLPKIINKSPEEMDALLRKIRETNLNPEDQELVTGCIEFATWLPEAIREKNISIRNLQRLLFGEGGGRSKKKKKKDPKNSSNLPEKSMESSTSSNAEGTPILLPATLTRMVTTHPVIWRFSLYLKPPAIPVKATVD